MRGIWGLSWLALCVSWGCGGKDGATAPNLPDCTTCTTTGGMVHPSGEGGSVTEPDAGATEPDDAADPTDAASVTVTLSVLRMLSDAAFSKDAANYTGPVKVSSFDPSGGVVDTGNTGVILSQMLAGVAPGPNWFAVQDTNPTVTLASTLQPVTVDAKGSVVALSALNIGQLSASNIDMELLGGPVAGEATLVLVFRKGATAVSGVSVSGNPGASRVAYYTGNSGSPYQTMDKGTNATSAESTVMVTHVPAAAQFPQLVDLTLRCTLGNQPAFDVKVKVAQKFATWMLVEVP